MDPTNNTLAVQTSKTNHPYAKKVNTSSCPGTEAVKAVAPQTIEIQVIPGFINRILAWTSIPKKDESLTEGQEQDLKILTCISSYTGFSTQKRKELSVIVLAHLCEMKVQEFAATDLSCASGNSQLARFVYKRLWLAKVFIFFDYPIFVNAKHVMQVHNGAGFHLTSEAESTEVTECHTHSKTGVRAGTYKAEYNGAIQIKWSTFFPDGTRIEDLIQFFQTMGTPLYSRQRSDRETQVLLMHKKYPLLAVISAEHTVRNFFPPIDFLSFDSIRDKAEVTTFGKTWSPQKVLAKIQIEIAESTTIVENGVEKPSCKALRFENSTHIVFDIAKILQIEGIMFDYLLQIRREDLVAVE